MLLTSIDTIFCLFFSQINTRRSQVRKSRAQKLNRKIISCEALVHCLNYLQQFHKINHNFSLDKFNETATNPRSLTNLNILKEDVVCFFLIGFDLLLIRWNRTGYWWLTCAWIFFYTKKTSKTHSSVRAFINGQKMFMPCTNTLFTAIAAIWSRKRCWSKSNITSIKRYTTEFKFH